jgi:hypothetical protein
MRASDSSVILNKTRSPHHRYRVIHDGHGMGSFGDPPDSPQHEYVIACGTNSPTDGYQGYMSIGHVLKSSHFPKDARKALISFLKEKGFGDWLKRVGA